MAVLYCVLKSVENDELQGKETSRAQHREGDQRPKKGLFAVKRLETARRWMVAFLQAALERPSRKIHVGQRRTLEAKVMCDASPEGLGAVLVLDGMIVSCLSSAVTDEDAQHLQFEKGSSSSQGIVESLAGLELAFERLPHATAGARRQPGGSGSHTTFGASTPSLNFVGAELSLALEAAGVERIEPLHIPGV